MEGNNLFGNIEVYHPLGHLMFYCDKKRIDWYLDKKLAIHNVDNKYTLTFTPAGLGEDVKHIILKENICVVCGCTKEDMLSRHHVVPKMYKKLMPENIKNRSSYDILMVCRSCHDVYEKQAEILKNELAKPYITNEIIQLNKDKIKIRTLYRNHNNRFDIPEEKQEENKLKIKKLVEKIYNKPDIDDDILKDIDNICTDNYYQSEVIKNTNDLFEFIKM
jgi:hypothetical protein